MNLVKSPGFVEISSSSNRQIVWYYAKNIANIQNYIDFLSTLKPELVQLLKTRDRENPIQFYLNLEATYNRPRVDNSSENRAFKNSLTEIFEDTNITELVVRANAKL